MTAIQVSSDNYVDIMNLPCVKSCTKMENKRFNFFLTHSRSASDGDWIINPESEHDSLVMSDKQFHIVKQAIDSLAGRSSVATKTKWKIPKRTDEQSLDDWIKSMVGDDKQLYELLHEVSVESYIIGTRISFKDDYESK